MGKTGRGGKLNAERRDVAYADDSTMLLIAASAEDLCAVAHFNVGLLRTIFFGIFLELSAPKCNNINFSPYLPPLGIYRRAAATTFPAAKQRLVMQNRAEGKFGGTRLDFDPTEEVRDSFGGGKPEFPSPNSNSLKVFGVQVDSRFTRDEHFPSVVERATIRQGILNKVAGCRWGLKVGA